MTEATEKDEGTSVPPPVARRIDGVKIYGPKPLNLIIHLVVFLVLAALLQRAAPQFGRLIVHIEYTHRITSTDIFMGLSLVVVLIYVAIVLARVFQGLPRITLAPDGLKFESLFVSRQAAWSAISPFEQTVESIASRYGIRERFIIAASVYGPDASPNVKASRRFPLQDRGDINVDFRSLAGELNDWRARALGLENLPPPPVDDAEAALRETLLGRKDA